MKGGSSPGIVLGPELAAMSGCNRSAHRETKPEPVGLGREERFEHAFLAASRQSDSRVCDLQVHIAVVHARDTYPQTSIASGNHRHRFAGVDDQIQHDLE